jgi:hypothetical protein
MFSNKYQHQHQLTLSPGQGLLLLIDHYQDDKMYVQRLKKLYLCGADSVAEYDEIREMLSDALLSEYTISYTAQSINSDPTRRYFETHLAYETLRNGLDKISYIHLNHHFDEIATLITPDQLNESEYKSIEAGLQGNPSGCTSQAYHEYSVYLNRLRAGTIFNDFSAHDKEKIELLIKSSFFGLVNAAHTVMPLNIYGKGIFSEQFKGKVLYKDQRSTRNLHLGLLKGHMPIAMDDIVRSEVEIPYLKPSDKASYVGSAGWVECNFNQLMHPFSNSISGTMLCQLRVLAKLQEEGCGVFTESSDTLKQFAQLLISAMLFCSGGHSLNEYVAPFTLRPVRLEFKAVAGFDTIDLESMFLSGNELSVDAAIQKAIDYNQMILRRANVHADIGFHARNQNMTFYRPIRLSSTAPLSDITNMRTTPDFS